MTLSIGFGKTMQIIKEKMKILLLCAGSFWHSRMASRAVCQYPRLKSGTNT